MSYVAQGINPYTRQAVALFNWRKFADRRVAHNPFRAIRARAEQLHQRVDAWLRLEIDGDAVGCKAGHLTLCYDVERRPLGVEPSDEGGFRLGLSGGQEATCILRANGGRHQLGGMPRWHQVDDTVLTYFVSGAYLRDDSAVRALQRSGLAPGSLRTAVRDGGRLGAALDAAGVDPAELTAGCANWHQVCQLDSDPTEGIDLAGGRLHVFALFEDNDLVIEDDDRAIAWLTLQYT